MTVSARDEIFNLPGNGTRYLPDPARLAETRAYVAAARRRLELIDMLMVLAGIAAIPVGVSFGALFGNGFVTLGGIGVLLLAGFVFYQMSPFVQEKASDGVQQLGALSLKGTGKYFIDWDSATHSNIYEGLVNLAQARALAVEVHALTAFDFDRLSGDRVQRLIEQDELCTNLRTEAVGLFDGGTQGYVVQEREDVVFRRYS